VSFLFPSSQITLDAAIRDLASGTPRARAFAAHKLGDFTADPTEKRRAVEALAKAALTDDRPEVRAEACGSLGELGDDSAVPVLVERLHDQRPEVRQSAAIALGTIRHPDGFEPLAKALRDGPEDLRFQAATSLAEIDPARAFDPIVAALLDRDPQVVGAAALALGAIPGDNAELRARARTALLEQLDQPNETTRFDVAYALAELGEPAGKPMLVKALVDMDRAWDAVTGLGNLADFDALCAALVNKRVPAEATVMAAGAILRKGGPVDAARSVLLAALFARKLQVRGLAVEQLTEVGGDWAVPELEKLGRSGKGSDLHEAIVAALRAIDARRV
jgi:HEAT repeat protein